MAYRRILYGTALASAFLLQVFYDGYLAHILFAAVLALPILSLLLTLPGVWSLRLRLVPSAPELIRGKPGRWDLYVENGWSLPLAKLTLTLSTKNKWTGWKMDDRVVCSGLSGGAVRTVSFHTGHCGRLECRGHRLRVLDLLGLFSIPLRPPAPAAALVLPAPVSAPYLPELDSLMERPMPRPKPGGGPSEDYDLRAYRPGDAMRSIHWKLSSKWDDLVVREALEMRRPMVVLTFDCFGPPEALDRVLDRLWAVSTRLTDQSLPHQIAWADPRNGKIRRAAISRREGLHWCMDTILSQEAPLQGISILDTPAPEGGAEVHYIHITAGEEEKP